MRPNAPVPQPGGDGWFVWDSQHMRTTVDEVIREVTSSLPERDAVRSVAVTGFGADGAPFADSGTQRYPIISWHDTRASEQARQLVDSVGIDAIYSTTGYHPYAINTLNRWLWLRENAPASLEHARWLMVPDIASYWLSGAMRTDPTSASTTMAFDLRRDVWAADLLEAAGVPADLPAPRAEPGEAVGTVHADAAERTGLPVGAVVAVGGHDCEVGTYAATGSLPGRTFVDITGTWEMLIVLTQEFTPTDDLFQHGIDWERHAVPGTFLCQSLMPAGSVLMWLRELAYAAADDGWRTMVDDAAATPIGAGGVVVVPAFVEGLGPFGAADAAGSFLGLRTTTTRGQLVRATLEALCYQLRAQLDVLERATGRSCDRLRVLGGGQRNEFWLQLKADVTGVTVEAVQTEELTLLGAALLGGVAAGAYADLAEAQSAVSHEVRVFEPDPSRGGAYGELFEDNYVRILRAAGVR